MEKIILSIAFYEQYPTFEMYWQKQGNYEIESWSHANKNPEEAKALSLLEYNRKTTIARVALANGFKNSNQNG